MSVEERLRNAGERAKSANAELEQARRELHAAILAAHKKGMSVRKIAALAGVSFQRVHQIVHGL